MSAKSARRTFPASIYSLEASLAQTSRSRASAKDSPERSQGSGTSTAASSTSYGRKRSSSKTCSGCARPDCERCLPTLPFEGSMRNGRASALPRSEPRICDDESSSLLPTPTASRYGTNPGGLRGRSGKLRPSIDSILKDALLPTPTVSGDWNVRGKSPNSGDGLATVAGSSVRLREWMMGLPENFTEVLEDPQKPRLRNDVAATSKPAAKRSATPSSSRARKSSAAR